MRLDKFASVFSLAIMPVLALATDFPLIEDGLVYRLDASDVASITLDGDGKTVTEWRSTYSHATYGNVAFTNWVNTSPSQYRGEYSPAWYKADGIGSERPAVMMSMKQDLSTTNRCVMLSDTKVTVRTVGIVFKDYDAQRQQCIWGNNGNYITGANVNSRYISNGSFLSGGRFWLDSVLWFFPGRTWTAINGNKHNEHTNNSYTGNTPLYLVGECSANNSSATTPGWSGLSDVRRSTSKGEWDKYFAGGYGEVIAYDRVLTEIERKYLEAHFVRKWKTPRAVIEWKTGVTGNWNDAANWVGETVPTAADDVLIASGTITITADAVARAVHFGNVNLTLAAGKSLSVIQITSTDGAFAVSAGEGSLFKSGEFLKIGTGSFAFASSGATLEVSTRTAGKCGGRSSCDSCACEVPEKFWTVQNFPATLSGNGTFRKSGSGILDLTGAALGANWTLDIVGGKADLKGNSFTLKALTGNGKLVNTSEDASTVDIVGTDDVDFKTVTDGNITVVFSGNAKRNMVGEVQGGKIALNAGEFSVSTNFNPAAIPGLVVHFDAQDRDSFILDSDNFVTEARNSSGNITKYTVPTVNNEKFEGGPYYDATALNGKPGFRFCWARGGSGYSAKLNALVSDSFVTNRTYFFVLKDNSSQFVSSDATSAIYGWYNYANSDMDTMASAITYTTTGWNHAFNTFANGQTYIDGKTVYDAALESNPSLITAKVDRVALYTWRSSYNQYGRPILGDSYYSKFKRTHTCAIGEIVVYDRPLSDDDVKRVDTYLMKKWGITPDATAVTRIVSPLASAANVTLGPAASLNLGGYTNEITCLAIDGGNTPASASIIVSNGVSAPSSVSVKTTASGAYPCVTGNADWFVEGTDFAFSPNCPMAGLLVKTSGFVTGIPDVTTGAKQQIAVKPHSIGFDCGFFLLIK